MTTIQQLMQTGSVKASGIFTKLADTSASAIKMRDRLFSDLKAELDRLAEFEEQRLFPVLRKQSETKDLVAQALNDNRQMRKLLAELEHTPKDSEAFVAKVTELRDLFQKHLRDDRKEILPAVVKVLEDEETGTAAGKTEGQTTEITPPRRADGGGHRSEEEREAAAAARQSADIVKIGTDVVQQGATLARMATEAGADAAGESDRAIPSGTVRADRQGGAHRADPATVGRLMVALLNEQARYALQAQTVMAAGRARRLAEVAQVQSAFMAAGFQRMGQLNDRYLAFVRGWRGLASVPFTRR